MRDAGVFSTLVLKSGYWQIPLDPDNEKYTAFATPTGGTFQFRVIAFGLYGAPGTSQRLMSQETLIGYIGRFCKVYIDDIFLYSWNMKNRLWHLTLVIDRLHLYGWTVNVEKRHFGVKHLEYQGYVVTVAGNDANPSYVVAIAKTLPITTKKQLQSLLGTCNWLKEYVPHFAILIAPLTDLTENKKFSVDRSSTESIRGR